MEGCRSHPADSETGRPAQPGPPRGPALIQGRVPTSSSTLTSVGPDEKREKKYVAAAADLQDESLSRSRLSGSETCIGSPGASASWMVSFDHWILRGG